ncbi:hypothetical protein TNCV_1314841 [Trichonephila clavipes]|uniref:Uncharacterized protein n=1 Tax=Trichonephila clavipes TaxID=2585209 RepID=A0A8X6SN89_TRICX|nr:hypothetical protein TNCV_1314841 [Trichonephila clavipes]
MLNSCVMHRHTGPAPGIMVWGGIGYHSRSTLVRIADFIQINAVMSSRTEKNPCNARLSRGETYHPTSRRGERYFGKGNFNDIDLEITHKPGSNNIEKERGNFRRQKVLHMIKPVQRRVMPLHKLRE